MHDYVRLDEKGLQKVFEKMKALASKYDLKELDEDLKELEQSLGSFAYKDNASGLYTPEGSVSLETTKATLREETSFTLDGENLIISLGDQVDVLTKADATFAGTEGNISVS
jgi:hypothetical protein